MGYEKIDYAAILADLEAKRTVLDTAIASLRTLVDLGTIIGVSDGISDATPLSFSGSGGGGIPDGAFHDKTIPEGIRLYLELMRKKQTAREIADGLKKGGMESTSKWFDKIVYATLDRLKKAGHVVKIEGNWGLPSWYPALMRAGAGETNRSKKIVRKAVGRPRKSSLEPAGRKLLAAPAEDKKTLSEKLGAKPEPSPADMIDWFLRDNPGLHTAEHIQSQTGIKNLRVTMMLLGQLVKKGKVEKTADRKYRKAS